MSPPLVESHAHCHEPNYSFPGSYRIVSNRVQQNTLARTHTHTRERRVQLGYGVCSGERTECQTHGAMKKFMHARFAYTNVRAQKKIHGRTKNAIIFTHKRAHTHTHGRALIHTRIRHIDGRKHEKRHFFPDANCERCFCRIFARRLCLLCVCMCWLRLHMCGVPLFGRSDWHTHAKKKRFIFFPADQGLERER